MSNENGGPAFPYSGVHKGEKENHIIDSHGMTMRDYFAARAMQAWLTQIDPEEMEEMMERWADNAYEFADCMLKSRKNRG